MSVRPAHGSRGFTAVMVSDDDVVVHDVHGARHQGQGAHAARRRVPLLRHGARPARRARLRHRVRHDGERTMPAGHAAGPRLSVI